MTEYHYVAKYVRLVMEYPNRRKILGFPVIYIEQGVKFFREGDINLVTEYLFHQEMFDIGRTFFPSSNFRCPLLYKGKHEICWRQGPQFCDKMFILS